MALRKHIRGPPEGRGSVGLMRGSVGLPPRAEGSWLCSTNAKPGRLDPTQAGCPAVHAEAAIGRQTRRNGESDGVGLGCECRTCGQPQKAKPKEQVRTLKRELGLEAVQHVKLLRHAALRVPDRR